MNSLTKLNKNGKFRCEAEEKNLVTFNSLFSFLKKRRAEKIVFCSALFEEKEQTIKSD